VILDVTNLDDLAFLLDLGLQGVADLVVIQELVTFLQNFLEQLQVRTHNRLNRVFLEDPGLVDFEIIVAPCHKVLVIQEISWCK